jgi:hypothetical protein
MRRAALAALALLPGLGGCAFTVGRLALVSTREPGAARAAPRHVTGRSCLRIVGVFPAGRLPSVERAVDAALAAGGGTAVRNAEVRYEIRYVPLLFGRACYVVEGDVS